jgi:hypothetical protein
MTPKPNSIALYGREKMSNTATRLHIKDSVEKILYTDELIQLQNLIALLRERKDAVKGYKSLEPKQYEMFPEYIEFINQKIKDILYL